MKTTILSLTCVLLLAGGCTTSATGILFVRSYNGSDSDLYIMNEDGTDLQAVDITPSNVSHGDFSPDGKTFLYCAETTPGSVSIFQVPVGGGTHRVVPGGADVPVYRPCWGSSTDRYFYGGVVGGPCGNRDIEIHRVTCTLDAEGLLDELLSDEIILSTKNVQLWDINEGLNKMSCTDVIPAVCYSAYWAIATYYADGSNRYVLPVTVDNRSDSYAIISPSGEYILYAKSETGSGDPHNVYRIRWDGTGQQKLTNHPGQAAYAIWRDDDTIFYPVAPSMYSIDYVLHRYTISADEDVVIPCALPNCVPVAYFPFPSNTPPLANGG